MAGRKTRSRPHRKTKYGRPERVLTNKARRVVRNINKSADPPRTAKKVIDYLGAHPLVTFIKAKLAK